MPTEEIYYVKQGRKYVPVRKFDNNFSNSMPFGTHLVINRLNASSTMYHINPDFAPMIAAGKFAHADMANVIVRNSEAKPRNVLTPSQQQAWNKFAEQMGNDFYYIEYPSAYDSITAGLSAMEREAEYMLQKPIVKKAYDHFMTIWQLAKDKT